jgi:dodecin
MSVARVTEVIAASKKSFADAIDLGVGRANKTLKNVTGAWVKDQSMEITKGKVTLYKVVLKITFIMNE